LSSVPADHRQDQICDGHQWPLKDLRNGFGICRQWRIPGDDKADFITEEFLLGK